MSKPLTEQNIRAASSDDALQELLQAELERLFPSWLFGKGGKYREARQAAPPGMRAMAGVYELDVSMTLDDLAWHFVNHRKMWKHEETAWSLLELGQQEASEVFRRAMEIVAPKQEELNQVFANWSNDSGTKVQTNDLPSLDSTQMIAWLDDSGLSDLLEPLDERLEELVRNDGKGVFVWWPPYARNFPERCVGGNAPPVYWRLLPAD